jgi:hypothetical protein
MVARARVELAASRFGILRSVPSELSRHVSYIRQEHQFYKHRCKHNEPIIIIDPFLHSGSPTPTRTAILVLGELGPVLLNDRAKIMVGPVGVAPTFQSS